MNDKIKLDSIEDAIADFKEGKFLIVVDDEDRENEGDFIIAAEKITPEKVNFMLKHARGVLCAPITLQRCKELDLDVQVSDNTSMLGTPFTVTVDKLEGCSTGVSAHDRAATIRALADPNAKPADFGRPGHINPLYAQDKGVLRRTGHTEAAVDLARLAGLYPAGALMEIMNDDGTMARLPELKKISEEFGIKLISINDLVAYRLKQESIVEKGEEVDMPTKYGHFRLIPFLQKSNGLEHMAIVKGEWEKDEPILVRVHSSCATGDILGSYRCDCGAQLHKAMEMIEKEGKGVVVYLNQEGRGIVSEIIRPKGMKVTFLEGKDWEAEMGSKEGTFGEQYELAMGYKMCSRKWLDWTLPPTDDAGGHFFNGRAQGVNWRMIRYSDVLLMYAEAVVMGGKATANITPLEAINKVRDRVGVPHVTEANMRTIEDERILELTYEGFRFFDLLRWGKVVERFRELENTDPLFKRFSRAQYMGFKENKNEWVPLPIDEVEGNPYITKNNPGW